MKFIASEIVGGVHGDSGSLDNIIGHLGMSSTAFLNGVGLGKCRERKKKMFKLGSILLKLTLVFG